MSKIDRLGAIKAQIADLAKQEKVLKDQILEELGHGKHEGNDYTLTVFTQERQRLDLDAVRRKLSRQFIQAHTYWSDVVVFKLTARQRRAA